MELSIFQGSPLSNSYNQISKDQFMVTNSGLNPWLLNTWNQKNYTSALKRAWPSPGLVTNINPSFDLPAREMGSLCWTVSSSFFFFFISSYVMLLMSQITFCIYLYIIVISMLLSFKVYSRIKSDLCITITVLQDSVLSIYLYVAGSFTFYMFLCYY